VKHVRTLAGWVLLATATTLVVLVLQWQAPERTVEPLANRFLCQGEVAVGYSGGAGSDIVREVTCVDGRDGEDITALTLIVLGLPCLLVIATSVLLFRRFMAPHKRVRIRRAAGVA
jgi:hypothetical protein